MMDERAPRPAAGHAYTDVLNSGSGLQLNGNQYGDSHSYMSTNYTLVLHQQRTRDIGRNEAIKLTTSVSGLRRSATALHEKLVVATTTATSQLPPVCHEIMLHLLNAQQTLASFEGILHNSSKLSRDRASMVSVEQLVSSFTNAVLLFNDLQTNLSFLFQSRPSEISWSSHTLDLTSACERLDQQCLLLAALLNLLQCSDDGADDASSKLKTLTDGLLADNVDLRRRMESVETHLLQLSQAPDGPRSTFRLPFTRRATSNDSDISSSSSGPSFESELNASRVYRRNEHRDETMSFRSSMVRDYAWSELSSLTLGNISVVTVIALPIVASELFDASWYIISKELPKPSIFDRAARREWKRKAEERRSRGYALNMAAYDGDVGRVKYLLGTGNVDIECTPFTGETPLQRATSEGHVDVVQLLLQAGADMDSRPEGGFTPLVGAAEIGRDDIVRLLLSYGASPSSEAMSAVVRGPCTEGSLDCLQILLDSDLVDVNYIDIYGWSALHWAAIYGKPECTQLLLAAGANPALHDGGGRTPLEIAARQGECEVVKVLLQYKPRAERAIYEACLSENLECLQILLDSAVVDLDYLNDDGESALHWVAQWGKPECVRMLLAAGANPALRNRRGLTPFDIATAYLDRSSLSPERKIHYKDVIKLLTSHNGNDN